MTTAAHDQHAESSMSRHQRQYQASQVLMMLLALAKREELPLPSWFIESPKRSVEDANYLVGSLPVGATDDVKTWANALGTPVEIKPRFADDGSTHLVRTSLLGVRVEIWAFSE